MSLYNLLAVFCAQTHTAPAPAATLQERLLAELATAAAALERAELIAASLDDYADYGGSRDEIAFAQQHVADAVTCTKGPHEAWTGFGRNA